MVDAIKHADSWVIPPKALTGALGTCICNNKWKWKVAQWCQLFATPWTIAHQAPPSMEFSRQEYWSGLPFPSPGDLPDLGIKPWSPILWADALPSESPGNPVCNKPAAIVSRAHLEKKKTRSPQRGCGSDPSRWTLVGVPVTLIPCNSRPL